MSCLPVIEPARGDVVLPDCSILAGNCPRPLSVSGEDSGQPVDVVHAYYPLVRSVCRRFLRRPEDVDDAVQETFLKLAQHAGRIHGSVAAWIATAAHSTAIDLIRRAVRERQRRLKAHSPDPPGRRLLHQSIEARLVQAIEELDSGRRELITERFFGRTPMRLLAVRYGVSVSAVSRRISGALAELAGVLREMGIKSADELELSGHLGIRCVEDLLIDESHRFASDWHADNFLGGDCSSLSFLPGWMRPIRVGVLISYRSTILRGLDGKFWPAELQLLSTRWMPRNGVQLVSIVEADTADRGPVECAMREHEVFGGLIHADDAEALKTLDLIVLGWNRSLNNQEARAIVEAVRSGVGLLNEYWTGGYEMMRSNSDVQALMLAGSPVHSHHARVHGQPAPGHLVKEHPLLEGLKIGMAMPAVGCAALYRPVENAAVLAVSDEVIPEAEHCILGLGPCPMPTCLVGQLGGGRVFVFNAYPHERIAPFLHVRFSQYFENLLLWLCAPRRCLTTDA